MIFSSVSDFVKTLIDRKSPMIQSFSIFNGNNFPESYLSKVFTLSSNLSYVAAPGTARHCYVETVTLRLARSQQNIVTERRCGPATPYRNAFILCRNIGPPQYLRPSALLQFAIIFTGIHTSAFGLGTMVYIGLEFGSWFEIPWDSPCYQVRSLDMCKYFSKYSNIFRLCEE